MSATVAKRKWRAETDSRGGGKESADDEDLRARFRRAFEAKFKPLALEKRLPVEPSGDEGDDDDHESDESDWSGVSNNELAVEVIRHHSKTERKRGDDNGEMRAFMSSKPPAAQVKAIRKSKQVTDEGDEDDGGESANLKHDLALQRLLKESHLLDKSSFDSSTTMLAGKSRLKALDLRLQDLGAKRAISVQDKMPLAHRLGIRAKAANREAFRRKEAAENGIVLERVRSAGKSSRQKRDRGMGAPSVGRFRGGTLQLSSRDVRSIEGMKHGSGRRHSKGRKR